jgi:hypothetical protein
MLLDPKVGLLVIAGLPTRSSLRVPEPREPGGGNRDKKEPPMTMYPSQCHNMQGVLFNDTGTRMLGEPTSSAGNAQHDVARVLPPVTRAWDSWWLSVGHR